MYPGSINLISLVTLNCTRQSTSAAEGVPVPTTQKKKSTDCTLEETRFWRNMRYSGCDTQWLTFAESSPPGKSMKKSFVKFVRWKIYNPDIITLARTPGYLFIDGLARRVYVWRWRRRRRLWWWRQQQQQRGWRPGRGGEMTERNPAIIVFIAINCDRNVYNKASKLPRAGFRLSGSGLTAQWNRIVK